MDDPFYIGYRDKAPESVGKAFKMLIPVAAAVLLGLSFLLARSQAFDPSLFEFGDVRSFQGQYFEAPVPHLRTADGGYLLLVGMGKFGASIEAEAGSAIELSGTRILRDDVTMIEVVPGSERVIQSGPMATVTEEPVSLGRLVITGEIVESKCFLGVMNPAYGPVHRACTRNCLLGGIPAMIRPLPKSGVQDDATAANLPQTGLLITGVPLPTLLKFAATPVTMRGTMMSSGSLRWLDVDAASITGRNLIEEPFVHSHEESQEESLKSTS